jgi:hypothetical protein
MPIDQPDTGDPLAPIERLIEHYRLAKVGRLRRRSIKLWRRQEALKALVKFERPPKRVH